MSSSNGWEIVSTLACLKACHNMHMLQQIDACFAFLLLMFVTLSSFVLLLAFSLDVIGFQLVRGSMDDFQEFERSEVVVEGKQLSLKFGPKL